MKNIRTQQIEFKTRFYEKMTEENQKILDIFVQEKYHFGKVIKKAFYPHKLRRKIVDDFMIRVLFIIGVL